MDAYAVAHTWNRYYYTNTEWIHDIVSENALYIVPMFLKGVSEIDMHTHYNDSINICV